MELPLLVLSRTVLRTGMVLVLSILTVSCATLNKDQCAEADWYAIGLKDASLGFNRNSAEDHRRSCAAHGVTPDFERYTAGYNEGEKSWCTYDRGYFAGRHLLHREIGGEQSYFRYRANCAGAEYVDFWLGLRRGKVDYYSGLYAGWKLGFAIIIPFPYKETPPPPDPPVCKEMPDGQVKCIKHPFEGRF